jgi:hypothetical protein
MKSFAAAVLAILGGLPVGAQNQLVDLGVATGYAINNAGQVALSTGIYSNGAVTALPAPPGSSTPATALAINASGQVAGYALNPNITGYDPIAYINGSLIDIGSTILGGSHGQNPRIPLSSILRPCRTVHAGLRDAGGWRHESGPVSHGNKRWYNCAPDWNSLCQRRLFVEAEYMRCVPSAK